MIRLALLAALAFGPSFAERTGTSRPKLAEPRLEGCDDSELKFAIGQPYDEQLSARLRDESGVVSILLLRPGEPASMKYGINRLTVQVDGQGKVISARCG